MLRIVGILLTMFLLHLGVNEFLCGQPEQEENRWMRLFRRGKDCRPQMVAEVHDPPVTQLRWWWPFDGRLSRFTLQDLNLCRKLDEGGSARTRICTLFPTVDGRPDLLHVPIHGPFNLVSILFGSWRASRTA